MGQLDTLIRASRASVAARPRHAPQQLPEALGNPAQRAAVQTVALGGGRSLELITDLFNLLNLFNRDWGVQRTDSLGGDIQILELIGYDQEKQRGSIQRDSDGPQGPRRRRHPMADAARARYTF